MHDPVNPLPCLTTPRLALVPAVDADLDALVALLQQPEVRRYLCDDLVFPREQIAGFIDRARGNWPRGLGIWMLRERGRCIGSVELKPVEQPGLDGEIEPMIALDPDCWRRGYAAEALRAVIAHAFETLALPRLVALVDEPNLDSHRLMQKIGFTPTGACAGLRFPLAIYRLQSR